MPRKHFQALQLFRSQPCHPTSYSRAGLLNIFAARPSADYVSPMYTALGFVSWMLMWLLACERKEAPVQGEVPPPLVTAQEGVCGQGASPEEDLELKALSLGALGGYCEDPHAEFRAYGDGAKAPLDDVCLQLFNGECEVYKSYGLLRVNTGRYIHASGSPAAVNLYVSRFLSPEGAYGFFTTRVVAGADPKSLRLKALNAGVQAALGAGVAYVFAGHSVAELTYTNELETPQQMRTSAQELLPILARALGDNLKGAGMLPRSVQLLPVERRLPFGVELSHPDVLERTGAGGGAVGYYEDGHRRYRLIVAHRVDEDSAKDTLRTLHRSSGRHDLKDMPFDAFELTIPGPPGAPAAVWLLAQHKNLVVAAGDDAFALTPAMTEAERAPLCLSRAEKLSLIRKIFAANTGP